MANGVLVRDTSILTQEETYPNISVNANSYTEVNTTLPTTLSGKSLFAYAFICDMDAINCTFSTAHYSGYKITVSNSAPVNQIVSITVRAIYV